MSTNDSTAATIASVPENLTKKALTADHPTWCPGCGDFAVLAAFDQSFLRDANSRMKTS